MTGKYPNKPTIEQWYKSVKEEWLSEKLIIHDSLEYDDENLDNLNLEFIKNKFINTFETGNKKFQKIPFNDLLKISAQCFDKLNNLIKKDNLENFFIIEMVIFLDSNKSYDSSVKENYDKTPEYKTPTLILKNKKQFELGFDGLYLYEGNKYQKYFHTKNISSFYFCSLIEFSGREIMERYIYFRIAK